MRGVEPGDMPESVVMLASISVHDFGYASLFHSSVSKGMRYLEIVGSHCQILMTSLAGLYKA